MEKEFVQNIINSLQNDFDILEEVEGLHFSGKTLRIDLIVKPKDYSNWKNKNVVFGIEFKDVQRIDGDTTNFTKWIAQCADYANTKWDGFGYINILLCPGIYSSSFVQKIDEVWILSRVMGHQGIGELKIHPYNGLSIVMQHEHRIWSEKKGVEKGKSWNLERKFGSR